MKPDFMSEEEYNSKYTKSCIKSFMVNGNSASYFIDKCEKSGDKIKHGIRPHKTRPSINCKEYLVSDVISRALSMGLSIEPYKKRKSWLSDLVDNAPPLEKEVQDLLGERNSLINDVANLESKLRNLEDEIQSLKPIAMASKKINRYLPSAKEVMENQVFIDDGIACGVYFLLKDDEVVYVGQSVNVYSRIQTHLLDKDKHFESFSFLLCDKEDLNAIESLYIHFFDPFYNKTKPSPFYAVKKARESLAI